MELCCLERFVNVRCTFEWLLSLLYADAVLASGDEPEAEGKCAPSRDVSARLLAVLVSRLKLHVGDERPGSTCSVLTVLLQISKVLARVSLNCLYYTWLFLTISCWLSGNGQESSSFTLLISHIF